MSPTHEPAPGPLHQASQRSVGPRLIALALVCLVLLACSAAPAAEPIPLRAGPVTMVFEPDTAFLRYVKIGSHELWRGLYAPVRNQVWGTVRPEVTGIRLDNRGDHFTLRFEVLCRERDIDFLWQGRIQGTAEGRIEFAFDGTARSTFLRNRIGFCLLHGPSAAGRPWKIENSRGEQSPGRFPEYIAPHQPAKDIRAIAHEYAPGCWAHVRFDGEIFEMEDQRNWTDASFKTYCTPLGLPYPVRVTKGTKVSQKITLRLEGDRPPSGPGDNAQDDRVVLTLGTNQSAIPRLGLQVSSQTEALSDPEVKRLQALHLDHLRVNLVLTNEGYARRLRQAADQAKALGVPLHVGLHLGPTPEPELKRLAAELEAARPPISVWLVIAADRARYEMARELLRPHRGEALFGVGEDTNFTELNRSRPPAEGIDVVSFGVNPQIHAFDNASIIETLSIQGDAVRSARQFVGKRPIVVSPITLRPQQISQQPLPGELPPNVDVRQPTLFAAGWTLGSLKYLAEAGTHSVTYYETVGWKGIMESGAVTSRPGGFPSRPGELFAVYHVLRDLGEFTGGRVQHVESTDPLSVVGLALTKPGRQRLLVANLTDRQKSVTLRGLGEQIEVRQLNAQNTRATDDGAEALRVSAEVPLMLSPYGIAQIDRKSDR